MTWNYRIMRHVAKHKGVEYTHYALHEVYYDEKGKPELWTEVNGTPLVADTPEELIDVLKMMLKDAENCKEDILDYE